VDKSLSVTHGQCDTRHTVNFPTWWHSGRVLDLQSVGHKFNWPPRLKVSRTHHQHCQQMHWIVTRKLQLGRYHTNATSNKVSVSTSRMPVKISRS